MKKPFDIAKRKLKTSEVIAARDYQLATKDGRRKKVRLRIGCPFWSADDDCYWCGFRITGLEEEGAAKARYSSGGDDLQALYAAMQMALTELLWTDAYEEGRLTWDGFYDLGLPVSNEADRQRIRKDPEAERIMKEMATYLEDENAPPLHPRVPSRRQTPRKRS